MLNPTTTKAITAVGSENPPLCRILHNGETQHFCKDRRRCRRPGGQREFAWHETIVKASFWLILRARSHRATYPSNRATVALLLRRCKSFGTRYVWPCGRVTGPQGHLSTLFRRFARAATKSVILLLHKATVGL